MSARTAPSPGVLSPASNGAGVAPPVLGPEYPGLATRMIALAADVLIIQAVTWMVGGVTAVVASQLHFSQSTEDVLIAVGAVVAALWFAAYFVFFWVATGQTPGNRLMEIRVEGATSGRPLPFGRATARFAGALLSALLLFVGYLLILVDGRRRALHDRLVGSVMVHAPSAIRRRRTDRLDPPA
jgi:uncharacterized RDD family membrane protein YckC